MAIRIWRNFAALIVFPSVFFSIAYIRFLRMDIRWPDAGPRVSPCRTGRVPPLTFGKDGDGLVEEEEVPPEISPATAPSGRRTRVL
ncbi:hypothetical protein [Methanoculleus sp.]|uniref:hypothetical protein n=1 Tax=Methanoculleus sp. TaxID=90427 RepID=UPI002636D166|nr:hypothetical protein [Methanoculleus sp.]MDI6866852.1 hypothetical protein [Methanoculleus sp.]